MRVHQRLEQRNDETTTKTDDMDYENWTKTDMDKYRGKALPIRDEIRPREGGRRRTRNEFG